MALKRELFHATAGWTAVAAIDARRKFAQS